MFRVFADSLVCLHFIMVKYWNERASKRDREFEKGLLIKKIKTRQKQNIVNCFEVAVEIRRKKDINYRDTYSMLI